MHLIRSVALCFLGCVMISAPSMPLHAPVTPQSQKQTSASGANTSESLPTFHSTTKLVLVDVVVTNHNIPVQGLKQSQFHIFENGHEQVIRSFDEHRPPDDAKGSRFVKRPSLPPGTYTNSPEFPETGAVTVLLMDALNTASMDNQRVRNNMIEYLGRIKPGPPLAVFGLASHLWMITGFSTDLAEVTKVFKSTKTAGQPSPLLASETAASEPDITTMTPAATPASSQDSSGMNDSATGTPNNGGPMDAAAAATQFQADLAAFQTDQRVRITLDAMQDLARYLSAIPGRKNVIWFSGSFPLAINPDPDLHSRFNASRDYSDEVRETTEMIADARIAFYPVHAQGLLPPSSFDASRIVAPSPTGRALTKQFRQERDQTIYEQTSMQQIADGTGGKAYYDTNDLTGALDDVVQNGSKYYTIGYVPIDAKFDGKFHTLRVALADSGYKLAYRRGYYADPPDGPSPHGTGEPNLIVEAALHGAPPSSQILLDARMLPATDPLFRGAPLTKGPVGAMTATLKGTPHRYVIDLAVDLHDIAFDTTSDGSHRANVGFALVAYDDGGNRVNYFEHSLQLTLKADGFDKILAAGLPIRGELDLPPGQGSLRIVIYDQTSRRAGSLEIPYLVPAK